MHICDLFCGTTIEHKLLNPACRCNIDNCQCKHAVKLLA
jgi:hypothetical protein